MPPKRAIPLAEHFWQKVERDGPLPRNRPELDQCWIWTATKRPGGYGTYYVDRVPLLAHRVAWELTFGMAPARLHVLHHCDMPPCVRPSHLFLGTAQDNANDARRKGRILTGSGRHNAKLSDPQMVALRQWLSMKGPVPTEERPILAQMLGISRSYLNSILAGTRRAA